MALSDKSKSRLAGAIALGGVAAYHIGDWPGVFMGLAVVFGLLCLTSEESGC